jgi:hypothetical protein
MARQLTLLEIPSTWRLDDATREAGRRGIAEARASLQAALAHPADGEAGAEASREHPSHRRSAA